MGPADVCVWRPKAGRASGTSGRVCMCSTRRPDTRVEPVGVCVCVALEDQVCVWRGPGVCGARRPDARVGLADVCVCGARRPGGFFSFVCVLLLHTTYRPPSLSTHLVSLITTLNLPLRFS